MPNTTKSYNVSISVIEEMDKNLPKKISRNFACSKLITWYNSLDDQRAVEVLAIKYPETLEDKGNKSVTFRFDQDTVALINECSDKRSIKPGFLIEKLFVKYITLPTTEQNQIIFAASYKA